MERSGSFAIYLSNRRDSLLTIIILFLTFLSGTVFYILRFLEPVHPYPPYSRELIIEQGVTTSQIAFLLEEEHIIHSAFFFNLVVRLTGQDPHLQAGTYLLGSDMPLMEIIQVLSTGKVVTDTITIPEGYTLSEMGLLLEERLQLNAQDYKGVLDEILASYPEIKEQYQSPPHFHYLEGYLFPDTYNFGRGLSPQSLISSMVDRFFSQAHRYTMEKRAEELGFTLHEIVTIASMIEKEARWEEERPLISGVIHNRLQKDMPLQVDATILYVLPEWKDVVLYRDLEVVSQYNSYRVKGLPPGPISNPGLPSLQAALYPRSTDYYFYVARRDGRHIFSRTYQEHLQAIREVRR